MEPCLVSCWGCLSTDPSGDHWCRSGSSWLPEPADEILDIEQSIDGVHDADHAGQPSQRSRNGVARWKLSLVDRGLNLGFGHVVDQGFRGLCETVARLLRGLSGLIGVAMSPIQPSLAGRRDATGSGSRRGRHCPAITTQRRLPQLHPLSDPIHANRPAASVTRSLTRTSVPSLTSPYRRQLRSIPGHTHLQPVADRSRRC